MLGRWRCRWALTDLVGWNVPLERAPPQSSRGRRWAIGLFAIGILLVLVFQAARQIDDSSEPVSRVVESDRARRMLADDDAGMSPPWLQFMRNCFVWNGGTFGGLNLYVSCECEAIEHCWDAVLLPSQAMSHSQPLTRSRFQPWHGSKYAIVMDGPAFYETEDSKQRELCAARWTVRGMGQEAMAYEETDDDHRRIDFRAVDPEHRRFYVHCGSGGYPATPTK